MTHGSACDEVEIDDGSATPDAGPCGIRWYDGRRSLVETKFFDIDPFYQIIGGFCNKTWRNRTQQKDQGVGT
jgi:hypothetical protein